MKPMPLSQFSALKLELSAYNKNEIDMRTKLANTVSAFYPCEVMFDVSASEKEDKFYYESCFLKLKHESLDIRIRHDAYRKKYSILCYSLHDFKNVTHYTITDEQKKLVEPKNIGVLTAKKITDWINYYEQLYKNLAVINEGNDNNEQKFLDSLKGLDVKFYGHPDNKKRGEIIKNGIKFSFEISPSYISQKIEVYYEADSNLDTFLQLSDNKYGKKIHY